jgi:hypothetical protein
MRHNARVTRSGTPRVRYRDVLADREFRAMYVAGVLSLVGDQLARIAVALLVYERSGSAFYAAATIACSYLTWVLGGPLLSALPDRFSRRRLMIVCDVLRMVLVALLALPGLPLWLVFAVLAAVGLLAPPFEAARSALLADVLQGERFLVGNAMNQATGQAGQVVGFAAGGALVAVLGVSGALVVDAVTFGVSTVLLVLVVREHPLPARVGAAAVGFLAEAAEGARVVWHTPRLRRLLAWGLLSAAVVIAPEGLAVAVSDSRGGGAVAAGLLTASVPLGFLLGSVALLRLPAQRRDRLYVPLCALSCLPLLATPWVGDLRAVAGLWVLAGVGNALQVVANASYVQAVPAALRGRAFGVAATLLMVLQGLVLLLAGAAAEAVDPRVPVAAAAAVGLLLLPAVARLRSGEDHLPQDPAGIGRGADG